MSQEAARALVLFDIDGTLINSAGAGREAMDRAFLQLWGAPQATRGVAMAGRTDLQIIGDTFRAMTGEGGVPPTVAMIEQLQRSYLANLPVCLTEVKGFTVLPGARELLVALAAQRHVIVALATGNIAPAARLKLAKARLNPFFRTGGFGNDAPTRAGVVAAALSRVARISGRIDRRHTLLIGDTVWDVKAAKATGIVAIGVATGPDSEEVLRLAGADMVLNSLVNANLLLELVRRA